MNKEKILFLIGIPFQIIGIILAPFIILFMWLFMGKTIKEIKEFGNKLNSKKSNKN